MGWTRRAEKACRAERWLRASIASDKDFHGLEKTVMNLSLYRSQDSAHHLNLHSHLLHALVLGAIVAALALLCSSSAAFAAEKASAAFLKHAAEGDMAETDMGSLAVQKSENADVKAYGKMLVTDHGQHLTEVTNLAKAQQIALPSKPSAEQKAKADELGKLSGKAFDQAWIRDMVEDHKKEIAKFQAEAQGGDPTTAELAKKTLPVLQKHLETAESIQAKVGQ
jgi:putative membrane protein